MTTHQTPYTLLDLPPTATPTEIRNGYRLACMRHHPDRPHNLPSANPDYDPIVFLHVQAAYDLLSDPPSRSAYDANPYPFPPPAHPDIDDDHSLMTQKDVALENEARELITSIFTRHTDNLSIAQARRFDFPFTIRREINDAMKQMKATMKTAARTAKKLNVIRHRLSPTPYLHLVLRNKRLSNVRTYIQSRYQIEIGHRALAILTEVSYEYEIDPVPAKSDTSFLKDFKFTNANTSFIPGGLQL